MSSEVSVTQHIVQSTDQITRSVVNSFRFDRRIRPCRVVRKINLDNVNPFVGNISCESDWQKCSTYFRLRRSTEEPRRLPGNDATAFSNVETISAAFPGNTKRRIALLRVQSVREAICIAVYGRCQTDRATNPVSAVVVERAQRLLQSYTAGKERSCKSTQQINSATVWYLTACHETIWSPST